MRMILVIIGVIFGILDLGLMLILDFSGKTALMNNALPLAILAILP
jgi:hypothetical protein